VVQCACADQSEMQRSPDAPRTLWVHCIPIPSALARSFSSSSENASKLIRRSQISAPVSSKKI
jgi:hypothetical protein